MNWFIKSGAIGGLITAVCCFTPVLVWVLSAVGFASWIVYLDFVLFPLLGGFIALFLIGLMIRNKSD